MDPQQVAQALQQVNQAKGDLNGNHNLQVAKDNANTAIDQLPNLNTTKNSNKTTSERCATCIRFN
ncbi:hypothetical protein FE74_14465 [Staphylococcus aureus]|nr:hypothetical protein FE74_14465 [Staphylococcus aureus]